jgi:hypothetical protein
MVDERCRPKLVADIGTGGSWSIQIDGDPGSIELAAQFARELAMAALRFAERCDEIDRAVSAGVGQSGAADGGRYRPCPGGAHHADEPRPNRKDLR